MRQEFAMKRERKGGQFVPKTAEQKAADERVRTSLFLFFCFVPFCSILYPSLSFFLFFLFIDLR